MYVTRQDGSESQKSSSDGPRRQVTPTMDCEIDCEMLECTVCKTCTHIEGSQKLNEQHCSSTQNWTNTYQRSRIP